MKERKQPGVTPMLGSLLGGSTLYSQCMSRYRKNLWDSDG